MELKEYQVSTLDRLDHFLSQLRELYQEYVGRREYKSRLDRDVDPCASTWGVFQEERLLPSSSTDGSWVVRKDGLKRSIPHICLKVPTGGGKTILATESVARILTRYLSRQTGLVLWVIPTEAIYTQTIERFRDREHAYRMSLERASGGRTKILEKHELFTPQDVKEYLCVMVVMLQSSARETKEQLRMFRDHGGFMQFFPAEDDVEGNQNLKDQIPNLDMIENSVLLKQSLGNVLKMIQPIIVLDEGHKAYSPIARNTIDSFNPRFVLELSATPRTQESNLLVDIAGRDLKREQMIKLPICLENVQKADWKTTLSEACAQLKKLDKAADHLYKEGGKYIRPIMLIRVDRTGKDTHHPDLVHADQVVEYLIKNIGVSRSKIRIKSASVDELRDEDLLSEFSKAQYIVTKDALREGWDCSFAYILTMLSKTTAETSLTQMIGRILRQPHAETTGNTLLDQCYIFCCDEDMSVAIDKIKKGLTDEGLGDLAAHIQYQAVAGEKSVAKSSRKVPRRKPFREAQLFLPQIVAKKESGGWRPFDYERDILAKINWDGVSFKGTSEFNVTDVVKKARTFVDIADDQAFKTVFRGAEELNVEHELDFAYLSRQLLDVIPNPWQAARITEEALTAYCKGERTLRDLYPVRLDVANSIRSQIAVYIEKLSEELFRYKLQEGKIQFRLAEQYRPDLDWAVSEFMEIDCEESPVRRKATGSSIEKGLFEEYGRGQFNELEREVALFMDEESAVRWWHRLVAKRDGDYALSGWQRQKIYPDFLVCIAKNSEKTAKYLVLETKGDFLAGNADTKYKKKFFDLLNESQESIVEAGDFVLDGLDKPVNFKMVMSDDWKSSLTDVLRPNRRKSK